MVLLATVVCQMCLSVNAKEKKYVSGIDFFSPCLLFNWLHYKPFCRQMSGRVRCIAYELRKNFVKMQICNSSEYEKSKRKNILSLFQFMCLFNCDFCFRFNFCWCNCVAK